MDTFRPLPRLPPEILIQVFGWLTVICDSYCELNEYLLICKFVHSCMAPRLFETLHLYTTDYPTLRVWLRDHRETLGSAVKRVHIPYGVPANVDPEIIAKILEVCKGTERFACLIHKDFYEDRSIAREIVSLPALRFLQINVPHLAFLLSEIPIPPSWFMHITCLSIYFWDYATVEPDLQAMESIDLSRFETLTRLCLDTEKHPQLILSAIILTKLPVTLKTIVVLDDVGACEEAAAHTNDPRVFFYSRTSGKEHDLWSAGLLNRERPKYLDADNPLDDWGEVTASANQCMWLWAEEARRLGTNILRRPLVPL
ncbi:hypothetical protein DL96DRAFT_1813968 [Flagelloscypha sp. PMI_526]|nr:hypothetical protein DL96DRAFT_1813968 [Flagelloscypha sp. PMI_526]